MKTYSLYELNEFIRRILALNLAEAIWVSGEFAQLNESRGHYFIDLVQKAEETEEIMAQASAVLWARSYRRLRRKLGKTFDQLLQEGIQVLVKVKVDFHERYGYKLIVEDIDLGYTLGKLEMRRRGIIEQLRKEQLIKRNAQLTLPQVTQRIAVLSSETAAGYQDFLKQLNNNPYRYRFATQLFPTAMQGINVEKELLDQLQRIVRQQDQFDAVVIIRGGGARLDLMAFDNFNLAKAIAQCPLPVVTGIGHEVDETIVDLVAHTALKTPTAVADFFINHHMTFESQIMELGQYVQQLAREQLRNEAYTLREMQQNIYFYSQQHLSDANRMLEFIQQEIPRYAQFSLRSAREQLKFLAELSELLSPEATLKRGYSLTQKDGKLLRSTAKLQPGDEIETQLADGHIRSIIKSTDE